MVIFIFDHERVQKLDADRNIGIVLILIKSCLKILSTLQADDHEQLQVCLRIKNVNSHKD